MAQISMRMDDDLKKQAESFFDELGLTMSSAFTIFVKQSLRQGKIPFEIKIDPFYSEANQSYLQEAIARMEAGEGTEHEIIESVSKHD